jgi:hypothetical protein
MPIQNRLVNQIRDELIYGLNLLLAADLVIDANNVVIAEAGGRINVSWTTTPNLGYLFSDFATLEHYQAVLLNRDYNILLADGSIVQVSYQVEGDEVTRHRLCYFPCPFLVDTDEIAEYGLNDLIDLLCADEFQSRLRLVSPVRFDFDAEFFDEYHHYSHMTTIKKTCRVPAFGPLSVGHFLRFVLSYFYQSHFSNDESFDELQARFYSRTLSVPPGHELFFETSIKP